MDTRYAADCGAREREAEQKPSEWRFHSKQQHAKSGNAGNQYGGVKNCGTSA